MTTASFDETSTHACLFQVLRKQSYKGSVSSGCATLPLDATTCMGLLQVLASILLAPALQATTIKQCLSILEFVDGFVHLNTTLHPLGKQADCVLEIVSNKLNVSQLKRTLQKVNLPWSRLVMSESKISFLLWS